MAEGHTSPSGEPGQAAIARGMHMIPLPANLNVRGNLASNWRKFRRMWNNYEIASRLRQESKELRTATLLTCIGVEALETYKGLEWANEDEKVDIDIVLEKLETFYVGATNVIYEQYNFNRRVQEPSESFKAYVVTLRALAKSCNYGQLTDDFIRDRIVVGVRENSLRKKLLQTRDLTLQNCIDICRASEATNQQLRSMSQTDDIHAVSSKRDGKKDKENQRGRTKGLTQEGKQLEQKQQSILKCKYCGKSHRHIKEECPVWGKKCLKCNKSNHFASQCQSKQGPVKGKIHGVGELFESEDEETEYVDYVLTVKEKSVMSVTENKFPKRIFAHMVLNETSVKFQLDSGATVNVLPLQLYRDIFDDPKLMHLEKTQTTLLMFNKSKMNVLGKLKTMTINPKNKMKHVVEFLVVNQDYKPQLGFETIQKFELMTVNAENVISVRYQSEVVPKSARGKPELCPKSSRSEPEANPKPVRIYSEVSLKTARSQDGSVRLCIDPKPLNKALKRNHYPHPDIEDLLPNLAKSKVFSVVDANNGFWHVQLDQESGYLTTFATPWGRYRWKRMPFGISPAPEEFQRYLDSALEGLEGIKAICDDILVCGVGDSYEEAVQDHDKKLVSLLERCRSKGIKLNSKKLLFRHNQMSFMGHLITSEGLSPDPAKVEAIQKMPIPSNKQAVRRLLGMVNYLQRFSSNLSTVTAPLRELLKEQNVFHYWREDVEEKCFNEVKKILSSHPLLKYFDPDQDLELQCDASEKGLGACLMQDGQPIAYAF